MKTQYLRVGSAIAAASALLALAACSASPSSDGASVEGVWGAPDTRGEPSLEFTPADEAGDEAGDATGNTTTDSPDTAGAPGGDYGGNDGCNTIGGGYTVTDGTINFGLMHSTMMFCEGVDTWLSQAHTGTVEGDTLTILNEQGDEIGTLERAAAPQ